LVEGKVDIKVDGTLMKTRQGPDIIGEAALHEKQKRNADVDA
jgi:hypothetical protein